MTKWERFQNVASGQFYISGVPDNYYKHIVLTPLLNWPFVNINELSWNSIHRIERNNTIRRKFSEPPNNFGRSFCDKIAAGRSIMARIIANVINIDGGFAKVREKSKKYDSLKTAGDKKNETRHQK